MSGSGRLSNGGRRRRRRRDKTPESGLRRRRNYRGDGMNGRLVGGRKDDNTMMEEMRREETRHAERRLEDEGVSISDLDRWANNLRMFLAKELSGNVSVRARSARISSHVAHFITYFVVRST